MLHSAKSYKEVQTTLVSAFEENKKHPDNIKVYESAIKSFEKLCQGFSKASNKDASMEIYETFIAHSQQILKAASSAPEESQLHLLETLKKMYEIAGSTLGINADRDLLGIYEALGESYEIAQEFLQAAEMYEKAARLHKKNADTLETIIKMGVPDPKPLKRQLAEYLSESEEYEKLAKELRKQKKHK